MAPDDQPRNPTDPSGPGQLPALNASRELQEVEAWQRGQMQELGRASAEEFARKAAAEAERDARHLEQVELLRQQHERGLKRDADQVARDAAAIQAKTNELRRWIFTTVIAVLAFGVGLTGMLHAFGVF